MRQSFSFTDAVGIRVVATDTKAKSLKQPSEVMHVSEVDPPVLTLHGDRDTLAPIAQAATLNEQIKATGASHTQMIFEGQGRGFGGEQALKPVTALWAFFDQHLKPKS